MGSTRIYATPPGGQFPAADARLIVAVVNALPDLLAALAASNARVGEMRQAVADLANTPDEVARQTGGFVRGIPPEAERARLTELARKVSRESLNGQESNRANVTLLASITGPLLVIAGEHEKLITKLRALAAPEPKETTDV
jgi:pimeloyl-ACP methyl ester carboxylesterase